MGIVASLLVGGALIFHLGSLVLDEQEHLCRPPELRAIDSMQPALF